MIKHMLKDYLDLASLDIQDAANDYAFDTVESHMALVSVFTDEPYRVAAIIADTLVWLHMNGLA